MPNENKTYLIFGTSQGLGFTLAKTLLNKNNRVFGISRSESKTLADFEQFEWIKADLSNPIEAIKEVENKIKESAIDVLIYNVGIWEDKAFTDNYNFLTSSPEEMMKILNTNVASFILSAQVLVKNLKLSSNAKIIAIGSTWGLENHGAREVTFSASKFALRGAIHSLRENLRPYKIGVSIINLGYLATEFDIDTPTQEVLDQTEYSLIPLSDVMEAIQFIAGTTSATCVKEIHMPAMMDSNV